MRAQVENRFGHKSEMTELSKDYLKMQMSPQVSWQMKLLATSDSTKVICTVTTACAPICDSRIRFYTTDWKELAVSDYLTLPVLEDFLLPSDSLVTEDLTHARSQIDMFLMKADLSKHDDTLTLTLTTPEYMEKETAEKLKPFIRRPLLYPWKSNHF